MTLAAVLRLPALVPLALAVLLQAARLAAAATATTTSAASTAIPTVAMWSPAAGYSGAVVVSFSWTLWGGKCIEASTYTQGAWLILNSCNGYSPFQNFYSVKQGANAYVLYISGGSLDNTFCVTLNSRNFLSLELCRAGYSNQIFNSDGVSTPFVNNACIAPIQAWGVRGLGKFASVSSSGTCPGPYVSVPSVLTSSSPGFLASPDAVTSLEIGGQCVTGMNPSDATSSLITTVYATTCDGSPEQNWLFQFGQIKNVATGLCLNAVGAVSDATSTTLVNLQLSTCSGTYVTTQMFSRDHGDVLFSLESYNCVHNVNGILVLGTGQCGLFGTDSLAAYPTTMTGLSNFVLPMNTGSCSSLDQRKEFRDLTSAERTAFFNALNAMRQVPSMLGRAHRYDDYNAFHSNSLNWYHLKAVFLPWHRMFLWSLEQDLKVLTSNSSFALPYYGWGTDSSDWWLASTGIFNASAFGTFSPTTGNYCVPDGVAASWVPNDEPCIQRFGVTNYISNPTGIDYNGVTLTDQFMLAITQINPATLLPYTDFNDARWAIEYAHNMVHAAVGGWYYTNPSAGEYVTGHMFITGTAASDPIFYMHHANIDRYYAMVQQFNPSLAYNGTTHFPPTGGSGAPNAVKASLSDVLVGFLHPTQVGWDYQVNSQCYTYVPYSKSQVSVSVKSLSVLQAMLGDTYDDPSTGEWFDSTAAFKAGAVAAELNFRRRRDSDAETASNSTSESTGFDLFDNYIGKLNVVTGNNTATDLNATAKITTIFPSVTAIKLFAEANNMTEMQNSVEDDHSTFGSFFEVIVNNTNNCLANLGTTKDNATLEEHATAAACAQTALLAGETVSVNA
ncbi:hypothetical protein HDU83_001000 [Entophlyctis luteolus]|nr:hypothetical protein HDU83_001000 [Entophlyctis luteolus]